MSDELFNVATGGTGFFYFSAYGYPAYADGNHPLSGTFDGKQITGFSTFGNPVNGVGLTSNASYPAGQNPYVGTQGILAQAGHIGDSAYQNGLSFTLDDGSAAHIFVQNDGMGGYALAYETTTGASGPISFYYSSVYNPRACFCTGTLIRAPSGEVAVETLVEGDVVLTQAGEARPVRWVGHTVVHPHRSPEPWNLHPIRVRAGAVAAGMPCRDLLVSPGHALLIGDVLINAGELGNGGTIVQEEAETIRYYHVELDSHDLLIADGMPCESYLDDGNRASFVGNVEYLRRHGRIDRASAATCRPLVKDGSQLIEARAALLARAAELGWCLEARPELRLSAGGRTVTPAAHAGDRYWFVLPDGASGPLRLRSASAIPSRIDSTLDDTRRLGVAIGELRVDGEPIALDAACFGAGFLPPESDGHARWRWTDGAATLALDHMPRVVEVRLQIVMPSWRREEDRPSLARAQ